MVKKLIIFLGPPGSGKSTLSMLLGKLYGCRVISIKSGNLFTYLFLDVFLVGLLSKIYKTPKSRWVVVELWKGFGRILGVIKLLDLICLPLALLVKVWLPMRLGCCVVADEFLQSTLTDYIYFNWISSSCKRSFDFFIRFLLRLLGSFKGHVIFLTAKEDILKQRWNLRRRGEPSRTYMLFQYTVLRRVAKLSSSFIYVDTSSIGILDTIKIMSQHIRSFSS